MTPLNIKYEETLILEEMAGDEDEYNYYKMQRELFGVDIVEENKSNYISELSEQDIKKNKGELYILYITFDTIMNDIIENDNFTIIDIFLTEAKARRVIELIKLYERKRKGFRDILNENSRKRKEYVEKVNIEMGKFGGSVDYLRGRMGNNVYFTNEYGDKKSIMLGNMISNLDIYSTTINLEKKSKK